MTTTPILTPKPAAKVAAANPQPASMSRSAEIRRKQWSGEDRYRMIAEAAYFRSERRGFVSGSELQDWLDAEIEVDDLLGEAGPR